MSSLSGDHDDDASGDHNVDFESSLTVPLKLPLKKIVTSYLGSFADRDPDAIAAHVAPEFVNEHTSALATGCVGRDAYRERLPGFLADMVDLRYEVEQLVADGDTVAAFYEMTARWQGESPIRIRGVQRLEVHDGLITHRTDYWDAKTFLDQVADDT